MTGIALAAAMIMSQPQLKATLDTPWSAQVSQTAPYPEYPRPLMVRSEWMSLNGRWSYSIEQTEQQAMGDPDGEILVPYPVESFLSGVGHQVQPDEAVWYRRSFEVPEGWSDRQIQLNFEAVDWLAEVYVNGKMLGSHVGGYDPFSFDITDAIIDGENELIVKVIDPTDSGFQPAGKQVLNPRGIWYTSVSGIWQSVWIEPVSKNAIDDLLIDATAAGIVSIEAKTASRGTLRVQLMDGSNVMTEISGTAGGRMRFNVENVRLWSPDTPHLYDLVVSLVEDGEVIDKVTSYCGFRTVELKEDDYGTRIYLNGEPIFMYGTLDQGWWPDGLYTAPTDQALRYDLEMTKLAGFNTVRKHVKVEPRRWYRHCDELGLIVWQDMPNGDTKNSPPWNRSFRQEGDAAPTKRSKESQENYWDELEQMVSTLRSHPSICVWVPFNEAWGQFETAKVSYWLKEQDPTRLVNPASGGNFYSVGDILDIHEYPGPSAPGKFDGRASVLGEFGGLGLPLIGHLWQKDKNWGYRSFDDQQALAENYEKLLSSLNMLRQTGLSAAIYTQTTDVEGEVNGLMTYNRRIIKIPLNRLQKAAQQLYGPIPVVNVLVPTSQIEPQDWRYTFDAPKSGWESPRFDDSNWSAGKGGFGTEGTPGAVIGTEWNSSDIWLRRTVEIPEIEGEPWLEIHHDEDAKVYLDGNLIADLEGYSSGYFKISLKGHEIRSGTALLAVHCKQTSGGQFIDCGLVEVKR
jgi:hypothetical protein